MDIFKKSFKSELIIVYYIILTNFIILAHFLQKLGSKVEGEVDLPHPARNGVPRNPARNRVKKLLRPLK